MKIEWKKSGDAAYVTLGDDAAEPRNTILIDQWDGAAKVQQEDLFRSDNPFMEPRGNVAGAFAFRATQSHADLDAAAVAFITERGRIGQKGELKITVTATVITYNPASLVAVARGGKEGVRQEILYTFIITAGTIA